MSFNNAITRSGQIVGFRCYECRGVFDAMWGDTCNACREKERRHKETLAALQSKPISPTDRVGLEARLKEINTEVDRLEEEKNQIHDQIEKIELAEATGS